MILKVKKYYLLKDLFLNIKKLPSSRMYIAGGSDISVLIKNSNINAECLIDISDIKELNIIKKEGDSIFIGSAVKIAELEKNSLIKRFAPALYECVSYYASPSIRNIATLGGNLANASPCADGVLALMALRAKAVLNLYGKRRICKVDDILVRPKKTLLKKDELIEGFIVDKFFEKSVFIKTIGRKAFGIAKAGICVCLNLDGSIVKDINIAVSSVAPTVKSCIETSKFLTGKKLTQDLIISAMDIIKKEIAPIDDHRSEADYRKEITGVMLKRALLRFI
ncbi:MAG: FAD binding domain-containing protein [Elusimicrobiota bacterium]